MSLENTDAGDPAAAGTASSGDSNGSKSLDDTLSSTLAALRQSGDSGLEGDEGGEGATPADAGRARGPDGKFVRAADTGADPAAKPADQTATEQQPTVTAKPHDIAPNTWKKEAGAEWAKLPENVRQEIHRREADFHRGIGQYRDAAGFGSQIAQELLPFQETINKQGIHPREIVKTLGPVWNTLVTGTPEAKAKVLLQVASDFGIDIGSLSGMAQQPNAQQTQVDDPRLATALQRIDKLEGHLTAQERQRAEAEFSARVDEVNAFGVDPKHPHFSAVREDMAALIESGRAQTLDDAYDKAIWINPEVRKLLLAEQEKERANKEAANAATARKAAGANVTRRGTPPVAAKAGSIEDTLRSTLRSLNGA